MSMMDLNKARRVIRRCEGDFATVAHAFSLRGRYRRELAKEDPVAVTRAVHDFIIAFVLADPKAQSKLFDSTVRDLCEAIPFSLCADHDLAMILESVARRLNTSHPGRPTRFEEVSKIWLRWMRAIVLSFFGAQRRAETLFKLCVRDFERRKMFPEFHAVLLDLGGLYFSQGRINDLNTAAGDIVFRYRPTLIEATGMRGALLLWRDAIVHDDLSEDIHLHVRRCVWEWLRFEMAKRSAEEQGTELVFVKYDEGDES